MTPHWGRLIGDTRTTVWHETRWGAGLNAETGRCGDAGGDVTGVTGDVTTPHRGHELKPGTNMFQRRLIGDTHPTVRHETRWGAGLNAETGRCGDAGELKPGTDMFQDSRHDEFAFRVFSELGDF